MLTISTLGNAGMQTGQTGMSQSTDYVSKNIQKQIDYLQKQLKELSSNENISAEEKQKKQQELQMQIQDLTAQLRQHQMEAKKEKGKDAIPSQEDDTQAGMRSVLSAETALEQAEIEGNVAGRLDGRAKVLASEIQMDSGRLGSSTGKLEEHAQVRERSRNAQTSQARLLGEAGKTLADKTEEVMDEISGAHRLKNPDKALEEKEKEEREEAIIYTNDGKPTPEETIHKLTVRA